MKCHGSCYIDPWSTHSIDYIDFGDTLVFEVFIYSLGYLNVLEQFAPHVHGNYHGTQKLYPNGFDDVMTSSWFTCLVAIEITNY